MKGQSSTDHNSDFLEPVPEACLQLARALSGCLKYFNDRCSQDIIGQGQPSFTPAVLGNFIFVFSLSHDCSVTIFGKSRHFGTILKVLGKFLRLYFVFGKMLIQL